MKVNLLLGELFEGNRFCFYSGEFCHGIPIFMPWAGTASVRVRVFVVYSICTRSAFHESALTLFDREVQ